MIFDKNKCTGCGSCSLICPNNCISMKEDEEGFRYPFVSKERCIDCGLCDARCPINNQLLGGERKEAFAAKNKSITDRVNSSSGGVFSKLAETVVMMGGVVCAAKYNEDYKVVHDVISIKEDIKLLIGAKYSQSVSEICFEEIRVRLNKGQFVMFVGTPCQTAGLQSFLHKTYDNLFLVDFICHGVPSPLVWGKYLNERRKKDANNSGISGINLRSKVTGWSNCNYSVEINYNNGKKYQKHKNEDWYLLGFIYNLFLRPSCANCHFKGFDRIADITLGDYWGVWDQVPEFDDDKGVSLVFIHSDKGYEMWKRMIDDFEVRQVERELAVINNVSMLESSKPHDNRELFFVNLAEKNQDLSKLIRICLLGNEKKMSFAQRVRRKIVSILLK